MWDMLLGLVVISAVIGIFIYGSWEKPSKRKGKPDERYGGPDVIGDIGRNSAAPQDEV